jgi:hypothetical protein
VAFWTDIFTLETWAQAAAREYKVTGFPAPTEGKGGYSRAMFDRVKSGDVLVCYCKRPAARWVGALRVVSGPFESREPVWGLTEAGEPRYPWRYESEPVVALDPSRGLVAADTVPELEFLSRLKAWGGYLQRSLNPIPHEDGERLLKMMSVSQPERAIHVPKSRAPHAPAERRPAERAERTLLDSRAWSPTPEPELPAQDEAPSTEPRTHSEIQGKLRDIGIQEGFDIWVADRGVAWKGKPLGDGCLADLPVVAAEETRRVMRRIDVIWFRKGTGHPERFFEIEHSTDVFSGLLRFNDVMIDFPITEAFIVGEGEQTRRKFEREIGRRTFAQSRLSGVSRFLSYDQVRETWEQYQGIGRGSRAWSTAG